MFIKKKGLGSACSFLVFFLFIAVLSAHGAPPVKEEAAPQKGDPVQGHHLFKHYCAVCHGISGKGNGPNAQNIDPHPADLTGPETSALSDQEIYQTIDRGGAAVELSGYMPPWGKTLSREQIQSLLAYIRSLQKKQTWEEGRAMRFSNLKAGGEKECQICHIQKIESRQVAPNLGHEGSKLNRQWLYQFLKNPDRIRPVGFIPLTKTKMPNFFFSDEEALALTEFLVTQKDGGVPPSGSMRFAQGGAGEVEKGKRLFIDKYACDGCHRTGQEEGGVVGPDLSIAAKRLRPEWMFHWIKNPKAIRPDSPMPTFGASDEDIRALVAFILSVGSEAPGAAPVSMPAAADKALVQKGEKIVKEKNCLYCHTLDPFNSQSGR
ncbi:MAG TPA: c-type cytochrome [Candidatus Manganitrophaceae bacterium]